MVFNFGCGVFNFLNLFCLYSTAQKTLDESNLFDYFEIPTTVNKPCTNIQNLSNFSHHLIIFVRNLVDPKSLLLILSKMQQTLVLPLLFVFLGFIF